MGCFYVGIENTEFELLQKIYAQRYFYIVINIYFSQRENIDRVIFFNNPRYFSNIQSA